jgi:hypothetical protein
MAQHDYAIANQGFPAFRSDLNDALAAIVSNNSGATEPTTMFAHQIWVDTAANPSILKIRNADNDAWITIGSIDQTGDTFTLTSAVSATTLNTSGAVVFNDAGADVDFRVEGDTDANLLFVDASADAVGIGTSSPAVRCDIHGVGGALSAVNPPLQVQDTAAIAADIGGGIAFGGIYTASLKTNWAGIAGLKENATDGEYGGYLAFYTRTHGAGNSERMRIDSSGNLMVGTTSANNNDSSSFAFNVLNGNQYNNHITGTANGVGYIQFSLAGTVIGSITQSGTTAVSYNTSSDYRLKENIAPMTGALAKVLELKPCTYTWKEDGSDGEGFIAHELAEVAPYAVSGEKDGEEMQGVDYGKITPLLTAALQEAIAEIQSLKARVAELEAK